MPYRQFLVILPAFFRRWRLWPLAVLLVTTPLLALAKAPVAPEVALLVDVSGSMKANDPQNLRKPAVELLTRLLPEGTHLNSWRFAETVEPLSRDLEISAASRAEAESAVQKIDSHGRLTDIETALQTALSLWKGHQGKAGRHLILLTDGFVDLGPDPEKNSASRNNILEQLLPVARAAGVHIHTVGLTGAADRELLRKLSLGTEGRYIEASGPESLQKAFLAIFDTAVPAERLPIEGNRFKVDDKVKEFTLLAFHPVPGEETRLQTPGGTIISREKLPQNIRWDHSPEYDLVTVKGPEAGEWQLLATLGPDSRVTIISDLSLEVEGMPVNSAAGQKHDLRIFLNGDGKVVTQKDFLMMTTVTVEQGATGELTETAELYNGPRQGSVMAPDDGVFAGSVGAGFKPGTYIVRVRVDGKTFSRSREQLVTVAGDAGELPSKEHPVEHEKKAAAHVEEKHEGLPLWGIITGAVIGVLVLGGGGFFGYVAFRKWRARKQAEAGVPVEEEEPRHSGREKAAADDKHTPEPIEAEAVEVSHEPDAAAHDGGQEAGTGSAEPGTEDGKSGQ